MRNYNDHATHQAFFEAVSNLASGTETLQERLVAAGESIAHIDIQAVQAVPDELKESFHAIWESLYTSTGEPQEGGIRQTMQALSDDEAKELAQKIVSFFDQIACGYCN